MRNIKLILISILLMPTLLLCTVSCLNKGEKSTDKKTDQSISDSGETTDTSSNSEGDRESKSESTESQTAAYKNRNYSFTQIADQIKFVGRTQKLSNGIACDFTASGVEFKAYIKGTFSFTVNCNQDTYFTVFVDGQRMGDSSQRFYAKGQSQDTVITVGDLGEMALREIRILKQTEPQNSICVLKKMSFYGELQGALPKKDIYIEFLGDSITCGYGNLIADNVDDANAGQAIYQDGTKTYAFIAAEKLGADASVISCSGIGIDKGFTAFNEMTFYKKASLFRDYNTPYDFSKARVPDVVVINLGTNDVSNGSTDTQFKQNAEALINFIRTSYGKNIPIVWAYNMMGNCCSEWTRSVLDKLGGEANGLYSVALVENHAGGNGHPSLDAQINNAITLSNFIKNNVLN